MAQSELSNRLQCLTSFTSQLVFVCSDKIKQPSQVVDHFISQQHESANIALITANELTTLVSYRELLFTQLLGNHKNVNFHQPLNQLLVALNNHEGPVVINVFQADKLPKKLVQELWELVLQSRFAKNKHQLNVLLIGQSLWAESMQQSFSAYKKEKPIILNGSSLLNLNAPAQPSLAKPHTLPQRSAPATKKRVKPLLLTIATLLFLAVFGSIIGWLYFDEIQQFTGKATTQAEEPQHIPPKDTPVNEPQAKESNHDSISSNTNNPDEPLKQYVTVGQEQLVTSWQKAEQNLNNKPELSLTPNKLTEEAAIPTNNDTTGSVAPAVTATTKNIATSISTDEQSNEAVTQISDKTQSTTTSVTDYQIEDKVPLDTNQKSINPVDSLEQELNTAPIATSPVTVKEVTINNSQFGDASQLIALPNNEFVIQIGGLASETLLQEYLLDNNLNANVWIYKTQRYGGDWFVILVNQSFESLPAAREAIITLPTVMTQGTPFAKSLAQVRQEITINSN